MSISLQQYLSYLQYLAVGLGMTALFAAVYCASPRPTN